MANIAIFKTGERPQYLLSVNTPEYSGDPDVLVNPDVSALTSVPLRYWKRVGDTVVEMTAQEKSAVEQAILDAKETATNNLEDLDAVILAKALVRAGLITKDNLVTAIKQVMN